MNEEYKQLVAAFIELMERGEVDQWKLAETAFLATQIDGMTTNQFAGLS